MLFGAFKLIVFLLKKRLEFLIFKGSNPIFYFYSCFYPGNRGIDIDKI